MSKEVPVDPIESRTVKKRPRPETLDDEVQRASAPPSEDLPASELLFSPERRGQLRGAWVDIQSSFIDEPRGAVRNADALVQEILTSISQRFENARRDLEAEWDRSDEVSTESLRLALQRYRALFDRLLTL